MRILFVSSSERDDSILLAPLWLKGPTHHVTSAMRSTAPSKRDIVLIVPRYGGGPPPSPVVLKKARLIAKKKGKKLLPLNVPTSPPTKEGEQTHPSTLEEELVRACGPFNMCLPV